MPEEEIKYWGRPTSAFCTNVYKWQGKHNRNVELIVHSQRVRYFDFSFQTVHVVQMNVKDFSCVLYITRQLGKLRKCKKYKYIISNEI